MKAKQKIKQSAIVSFEGFLYRINANGSVVGQVDRGRPFTVKNTSPVIDATVAKAVKAITKAKGAK